MIDRYQVRYFLAVAQAGSFTRAAALMNVTQPTLSIGIGKLEREVGARLFLRNARRLQMTDAGVAFLKHARTIEAEFNGLEAAAPQPAAAQRVVRLGVLASIPTGLLEAVVAANRAAADATPIEVVEGVERDLLGRLQRGRLDLALTVLRAGDDRFEAEPLFAEGYALALSASHPMAGEAEIRGQDLAKEVMIVRRHCEALSETSRHFTDLNVRPRFSFRSTNDDRVLRMVRTGLGITVMPDGYREPGVVRPKLTGFTARRQIGIIYARDPVSRPDTASALVRALRNLASPPTQSPEVALD